MIKIIRKNMVGSIFIIALAAMMIVNILTTDLKSSERENRYLQMFPDITLGGFLSGRLSDELIDYADDQFVSKDMLVRIKSFVNYNIFNKKLNNGIYRYDGGFFEFMEEIRYGKIETFNRNIDEISRMIGSNLVTVLVPDKSMYLPDDMIKIDYHEALEYLNMDFLDIYDTLSVEDYYLTDLHWNHAGAYKVYKEIIGDIAGDEAMEVDFEIVNDDFKGYYSNKAMDLNIRDGIYRAGNDILDKLKISYTDDLMTYVEKTGLYFMDQLDGDDKYDMYLKGNHPILTITNDVSGNGRELIVFKDSYANSIAPFLAMHYDKVTLIDLRIVNLERVVQELNMEADLLCLYGFKTVNDGAIMN